MKVLTDNMGNQWEVVEATSDADAWDAITTARVRGSVGASHYQEDGNGNRVALAIVRRLPVRETASHE